MITFDDFDEDAEETKEETEEDWHNRYNEELYDKSERCAECGIEVLPSEIHIGTVICPNCDYFNNCHM